MTLHEFRFPGESNEYRTARDRLLQAEIDLRRQIESVAAKRRELPLGGAVRTDYVFNEWDAESDSPRDVRISELFANGKDTLFLYSFMIVMPEQGLPFVGPCPSCTSIIDSIDGALPHVTQRVNFAVASKPPTERFRDHGRSRGWRHARLLSSASNTYNRDYGAEDEHGNQWPLATVFVRRDGRIHHFWSSELWFAPRDEGQDPRHVDFMWPIWSVFDRTAEGRRNWGQSDHLAPCWWRMHGRHRLGGGTCIRAAAVLSGHVAVALTAVLITTEVAHGDGGCLASE